MEWEANMFAMALLMPRDFLIPDFKAKFPYGMDVEHDEGIAKLAKRYNVSVQLMILRLHQLELIGDSP